MNVEHYTDLQLIASTNAAEIYEARIDDQPNRMFVLKKYKQSDISETAISNEISISQMVEQYASRSIVIPVLGTVTDEGGSTYLVIKREHAGAFLSELIEAGTVSLPFALKCTEEMLRSLATLHSFAGSDKRIGYLHLDLHPGNVFMENADAANETAGTAKFIDFATAAKIENGKSAIRTIAAVSPFSAPELYKPYNAVCTVTADLYSVAAIFYALFVGGCLPGVTAHAGSTKVFERPSAGPDADTAANASRKIRTRCEKEGISESVCRAVCAFMLCALDDNPVYRYQSAEDMLGAACRIIRLLSACEENDYETIFQMEYEDFADIDDVRPETLVFDEKAFGKAVESLDGMLHADHVDVPFTKYLFSLYWQMARPRVSHLPGSVFYSLISSGVAVSNHTGDVVLGQEMMTLLDEVRSRIGIEEYLKLNNRIAVMAADRYEFAQAAVMQEKNVAALRKIREGYAAAGRDFGMDSEDNVRNIPLARALSSLAVYKAIAYSETPREEIYALFDEAVREFGSGQNIKITQSHRMQYELMIGDRDSFERTCAAYFDVEPLDGCLDMDALVGKCVKDGKVCEEYGLYALVKALYLFYLPEGVGKSADAAASGMLVREQVIERLREIGDDLLPRKNVYDPVQTIFRYLALIEHEATGEVNDRVRDYFEAALGCQREAEINMSEPLNVYMLIAYQTCAIYFGLTGRDDRCGELRRMLYEHAKRSGWGSLVETLDGGRPVDQILVHEYA